MSARAQIGAAAALAWALVPALALADGIGGRIEAQYTRLDTWDTGASPDLSGRTSFTALTQRLRLTLDRSFLPQLRFDAGGTVDQTFGWSTTGTGTGDSYNLLSNLFANVTLGGPVLSGTAGYTRRSQLALAVAGPDLTYVREEPTLLLIWHPVELPMLTLRLSRPSTYDTRRALEDRASTEAQLTASWQPLSSLLTDYSFQFSNPVDRIRGSESTVVMQAGRVLYSGALFGGRVSTSAGLTVSSRALRVVATAAGGTTEQQQSPTMGYSLVEVFPATAETDTLARNAALVDGVTTAGAGLNLGSSVWLSGDRNFRDLGAQLGDTTTRVNTLYVWVDRQVAPAVASSLGWTVYQSDDNARWTRVSISGPVVFARFENRFEIPIAATEARYLKVAVQPLDPAATTDPAYSDLFVTELQLYLVEAAPPSPDWDSISQAVLNAAARTQITPSLSHDVSLQATAAATSRGASYATYLLSTGLGYVQQLSEILGVNARLSYQDSRDLRGRQYGILYSSAANARFLPTLGGTLAISGQLNGTPLGLASTNTVSLLGRAEPYRGVGLMATVSYGVASVADLWTTTEMLTATATLHPNPRLTLGATYGHTASRASPAAGAPSARRANRLEGSASWTPFSALYLAGSASWNVSDTGAAFPLANAAVSFSPFPGGQLQLSFSFVQSLEPAGGISRMFGPTARWNVRPGLVVTAAYSVNDFSGGSRIAQATRTQMVFANVQMAL